MIEGGNRHRNWVLKLNRINLDQTPNLPRIALSLVAPAGLTVTLSMDVELWT